MTDRFDVHAVRHRVKHLTGTGDSTVYDNRDGVRCPACDEQFERLVVLTGETTSVTDYDGSRFCLARLDGGVGLFTH